MKIRIPIVTALSLAALTLPAQPALASTNVSYVPCTTQVTTNCFEVTVNGNAAPADLHVVVAMSIDDQSNSELEVHLYDKTGVAGNSNIHGWDDAPRDQDDVTGAKLDLSAIINPNDVISVTVVSPATMLPQWSMVNGKEVLIDYTLSNGNLITHMTGKAAMVALPDISTKRVWDDPSTDYTGKCGHIRTRDVACDVQTATSSALTYFGRFRTFVDPNAFGFPGLWISTNATYYQFPRLGSDGRSLVVPTGAPHELPDGTVHKGLTRAYLPKPMFTAFGVEFTEAKVRQLLAVSQEKAGVITELPVTLTFAADGVLVELPEITFSSPVLTFGARTAPVAAASPSLPATGQSLGVLVAALTALSLGGAALVGRRSRRVAR